LSTSNASFMSKDDAHSFLFRALYFGLDYKSARLRVTVRYLHLKRTSRQLLGRRLSLCLTNKWLARILPLFPASPFAPSGIVGAL
jgi:hypothetical protein